MSSPVRLQLIWPGFFVRAGSAVRPSVRPFKRRPWLSKRHSSRELSAAAASASAPPFADTRWLEHTLAESSITCGATNKTSKPEQVQSKCSNRRRTRHSRHSLWRSLGRLCERRSRNRRKLYALRILHSHDRTRERHSHGRTRGRNRGHSREQLAAAGQDEARFPCQRHRRSTS